MTPQNSQLLGVKKKHIPEGVLGIIEAKQRKGKTMTLTAFALDAHQRKKKVYSNYALGFPYEPLQFDEIKLEDGQSKYWDSFVGIDELNFYYDARRSLTGANIQFGTFLLQQKKQGCSLFGTTHDLLSLDLRLRNAYDFLIQPKVFPPYPKPPQILEMRITNGPLQSHFSKIIRMDCRFLMGLYDSFAVHDPFKSRKASEDTPVKMPRVKARRVTL